jgi:hypothetical protein
MFFHEAWELLFFSSSQPPVEYPAPALSASALPKLHLCIEFIMGKHLRPDQHLCLVSLPRRPSTHLPARML